MTAQMIIKRDGRAATFDGEKIVIAIEKAMHSPTGYMIEGQAQDIAREIENEISTGALSSTVLQVEKRVFEKLVEKGNVATAKSYESYRSVQSFKRESNSTDRSIEGLLDYSDADIMDENSNKNAVVVSTQRDLIAGEVSKDIARRRILPTDIVTAHDSGAIHVHDMDYYIQPMFNCCLINLEDMLANGTVVNGKMIESPRSFQTACTITTQIIAQVASGQFGGQSINGIDRILAPYVRRSFEKHLEAAIADQLDIYGMEEADIDTAKKVAWKRTKREIKSGVQTIQYQINTLMTTNGQAPFVTLFMYFDPKDEYAYEASLITEEILRQRIDGIKNKQGINVTPAFPKLVYVLDEHNIHEDSPYYYLTRLAATCTAKRMYPDYISAKKMKEIYEGNVFAPMGCRSSSLPGKIKTEISNSTAASIWAWSALTWHKSAFYPAKTKKLISIF